MASRGVAVLALLAAGCAPPADTPKVTEGPWEPLEPQAPPTDSPERPALVRVLVRGQGPAVGMGNLVEVRMVASGPAAAASSPAGPDEDRSGWVWIGFDGPYPSDFPVGNNGLADALLGRMQGDVLVFKARPGAHDPGIAGKLRVLVFGDPNAYIAHKPMAQAVRGGAAPSDRSADRDGVAVEIVRVCLGRAEQRLVTVFDDAPVTVTDEPGRSHVTREPRWLFVREARWTGICQDGRHASFRYGPIAVEPPAGQRRGLDAITLWQPWLDKAWQHLPVGVVVD